MKDNTANIKRVLISILIFIILTGISEAQDSIKLTKKQEQYLLKTTVSTKIMGQGTFDAFASYLYAMDKAVIHTDNPEVSATRLKSLSNPDQPIPLRELFDEISKQTSSKWSFDAKRSYWLFSKPLPFEIEIAEGWIKQNRKGYIFYKPPYAPVGMDIYFAGKIDSTETNKDARFRIAKKFAEPVSPSITLSSMVEDTLPHQISLFYKTINQNKGIIWRQWAIAEKGRCFVIVSAIKLNDDTTIFPDVEKMVRSFKVIDLEN